MGDLREDVADGRVLEMIEAGLKGGVMADGVAWQPEHGTPQGGVISPLLANIYLHPVDVALQEAGYASVRYADDLVVLCRSQGEAERALELLRATLATRRLTLHPTKTRIANALDDRFDFLGYHFRTGRHWPRRRSMTQLREAIRRHTRRTNGNSLAVIIQRINPILRGWFAYFKHSQKRTFSEVAGWVRMRLRSILRTRAHLRGRGRGADHQRWPNAFFTAEGLFTMTEAHRAALQSH